MNRPVLANFGPNILVNYTSGHPIFYEAVFNSFGNVGPIFGLFRVKKSNDPTGERDPAGSFCCVPFSSRPRNLLLLAVYAHKI